MTTTATINAPCDLQAIPQAFNIASLTKTLKRQSRVLNSAFFMPKIRAILCAMGMNNRIHISRYGRVNEQNKIPLMGNMFSRLQAISDTRPPVLITDGQTLLEPEGGQIMPLNTSTAPTVGQFAFNINLPANSFIKRFSAVRFLDNWQIVIDTESGQIATIKDPSTKHAMKFPTLDQLASWLSSQGVPEMNVFLPAGTCARMGDSSTMGGAE